MSNKVTDFTNWLDDSAWNFDNDFLKVKETEINNILNQD